MAELTQTLLAPFESFMAKFDKLAKESKHNASPSRAIVQALLTGGEAVSQCTVAEIARRCYVQQSGKTKAVAWLSSKGHLAFFPRLEFGEQLPYLTGPLTTAQFDEHMHDLFDEFAMLTVPEDKTKEQRKARAAARSQVAKDTYGSLDDRLYLLLGRERPAMAGRLLIDIWEETDMVHFPEDNLVEVCRRFKGYRNPRVEEALAIRVGHDFFIGDDAANPRMPGGYKFLDLVVAARVSPTRRKATLWLQAPTGWGKSFLARAIECHGIVYTLVEDEIVAAFASSTSGLSVDKLANAHILHIDEITKVYKEFKLINEEIDVTPKFGFKTTVPVYLKLFTSAETIPALTKTGGVEDQFADRMSHMTPEDNKLNSRPLFQQLGAGKYYKGLIYFVGRYMAWRLSQYKDAGREVAEQQAGQFLEEFHREYALSNTHGKLSDSFPALAADARRWLLTPGNVPEGDVFRKGDNVYVRDARKHCERWMAGWTTTNPTREMLLGKNFDAVLRLVPVEGAIDNQRWLDGANVRSARLV
ncbi:hypothetical protein CNY89_01980 [Amaricoccus sp. HAR-UPW-R2A-40]|nr:hypothetical protein CNY89_01980 [Amaricoccus sp. HAR-UPW-R2A-40]